MLGDRHSFQQPLRYETLRQFQSDKPVLLTEEKPIADQRSV